MSMTTPTPQPRPDWTLGKYIDGKRNPLWVDIRVVGDRGSDTKGWEIQLPKVNFTPTQMKKIIGKEIEEAYITYYGTRLEDGKTIKYDTKNKNIYYREYNRDDSGSVRTYILKSHKPLPKCQIKEIKKRCFAINPFMTMKFEVETIESKNKKAGKYWKYQIEEPKQFERNEQLKKAKKTKDYQRISHELCLLRGNPERQEEVKKIKENEKKFFKKYNFLTISNGDYGNGMRWSITLI